jgi:hypothetical protein
MKTVLGAPIDAVTVALMMMALSIADVLGPRLVSPAAVELLKFLPKAMTVVEEVCLS